MISLCINFGLIPSMIDFTTLIEDYRRKSSMQISIMKKIFFFMFVNTLLIPILATTGLNETLKKLNKDKILNWPNIISAQLMA